MTDTDALEQAARALLDWVDEDFGPDGGVRVVGSASPVVVALRAALIARSFSDRTRGYDAGYAAAVREAEALREALGLATDALRDLAHEGWSGASEIRAVNLADALDRQYGRAALPPTEPAAGEREP